MKERSRSRLPQFEKSVFSVRCYQVLMRVVRYANHVFLVHLQPEVKVQNMHNCSRTVRYGKAENTSPTVIVRSSFPEAALKQYKTISSPTQYTHSPRGDTTAHRKSPPSRLPDEKLRTIWKKHKNGNRIGVMFTQHLSYAPVPACSWWRQCWNGCRRRTVQHCAEVDGCCERSCLCLPYLQETWTCARIPLTSRSTLWWFRPNSHYKNYVYEWFK